MQGGKAEVNIMTAESVTAAALAAVHCTMLDYSNRAPQRLRAHTHPTLVTVELSMAWPPTSTPEDQHHIYRYAVDWQMNVKQ
jgi:hypothetical protein